MLVLIQLSSHSSLQHLVSFEEHLAFNLLDIPSTCCNGIYFDIGVIWYTLSHCTLSLFEDNVGIRIMLHNGTLLGCIPIFWIGHELHVAMSISHKLPTFHPHPNTPQHVTKSLCPLYSLDWCALCHVPNAPYYEFGNIEYYGNSLLSCIANSIGSVVKLADQSHNHFAVEIVTDLGAHMSLNVYFGFAHLVDNIVSVHGTTVHTTLILNYPVHLLLCVSLAGMSVLVSITSQQCYALNPFSYLSFDLVSYISLWVHHQYISCIIIVGCLSHAGISLVQDYSAHPAPGIG